MRSKIWLTKKLAKPASRGSGFSFRVMSSTASTTTGRIRVHTSDTPKEITKASEIISSFLPFQSTKRTAVP